MKLAMRLFRRANGIYYVELDRSRRVSLKTRDKALAQQLYRKLKKEYLTGKIALLEGRSPEISLFQFAEEYLEHSFKVRSRMTWQTDCQAFKRIKMFLGNRNLSQITSRDLEKWRAEELQNKVRPSSINVWTRHLKAAFSKAVAWGYLKSNPWQGIRLLKVQESPPKYLTLREIEALLKAEPDALFRNLWLFLLLTGCRRSEALSLTWREVDWVRRRITFPATKNRRAKSIYITNNLEAVLKSLPHRIGRLFPWKPDSVSHHFQATAHRAGLKVRLHDLRHTFASHLAMAGVDLYTIKELLGHRDIKTTLVYAHLSQEHLDQALGKLRIADNSRTETG